MLRRGEARKLPRGAVRVERLDFTLERPQVVHDLWRRSDRVCRFVGLCVMCARRTYGFDDGENDPRGVLGDHATSALVAEEYGMRGPDVALCALCGNDRAAYKAALEEARRLWKPAVSE